MSKLNNYKGSIKLISGLTQANNKTFPLLEAHAVQTKEDGTRLDAELAEIKSNATEVKSKVEDLMENIGGTLHLMNGKGDYSVQTKHYNAEIDGKGSTYLGGVRYDDLEEGTSDATPAIIEANQSLAAGGGIQLYGDWNVGFNKETKGYQRGVAVFGGGCQAGMTESEFNQYFWEGFTDPECLTPATNGKALHSGQGLKDGKVTDLDGRKYEKAYSFAVSAGELNKAFGRASFIGGGSYNYNEGKWSHIGGGYRNKNYSNHSAIEGGGYNENYGFQSGILGGDTNKIHNGANNTAILGGYKNEIAEGAYNAAILGGSSNKVNAYDGVAGGQANEVNSPNSSTFGYRLQTATGGAYGAGNDQFITGRCNSPNTNALFQVGNGTSNSRSNAFEVLVDGRGKVYGAPVDDNDVVRKSELVDLLSAYTINYNSENEEIYAQGNKKYSNPDGGVYEGGKISLNTLPYYKITEVDNKIKEVDKKIKDVDDKVGSITESYLKGLVLSLLYPVGAIYITISPDFDPNDDLGGTWEKINGAYLYAENGEGAGNFGGEQDSKIKEKHMPAHSHTINHGHDIILSTVTTSEAGAGSFKIRAAENEYGNDIEFRQVWDETGVVIISDPTGTGVSTQVTDDNGGAEYQNVNIKNHTHQVTPYGVVYDHDGASGTTGKAEPDEYKPRYVAVIVWKRIK